MKTLFKKDLIAILAASLYLLIYIIFLNYDSTHTAAVVMLLFSPVIVLWMVYVVLKFGEYRGRELGKAEFGYLDKKDGELGTL